MPNYYDMSGEPAAASAQPTTGADNGPTAEETIGATTTGTTQEQEDVQRLHKYKLPPPFFTGDYSQYEEWLFQLQAYLGLVDRDFDMVLQLAQAATRQTEDADIRAHIRDPTQATKAVDLSRDLHYILINICQGAAATVVRQNRYNANGCETLRLLHNRFSPGYYKTISAFSRASSAVGTNYNGGTAPMDVDNIWRKGRNYKGKSKYGGKGSYKGNKGKSKYRSKGHYKGFDKGNKGGYNKNGYNKGKRKGYGSKGYGSSKGYKGQSNYGKSKAKGNSNYMMWQTCHWAQDCRVPVWHIGEGEELQHPEQEQETQDNNEELRQDMHDTSDWYYEGEEGHGHDVNYMEESWNDYDWNDNSWGWNDYSHEGEANYIGGINESHLTIGHVRQGRPLQCKHKQSLLGKRATHTTSWNDHSTIYQQYLQEDRPQLHLNIAAATQQQKRGKLDNNITHYIMYSNFKSYHHLLIDSRASTHVCPRDYAPDLPLRPCGESVPQLYTVTNKKIPVYGIMKYPILSASRLLDRGYGLDFNPRHCTISHGQQHSLFDTQDFSTYEQKRSTYLQDTTSTQ